MAKQRVRLDPAEVKQMMAAKKVAETPPAPFHSPFAAVKAQLDSLVPKRKKKLASERLSERAAAKPAKEPTELAVARAKARHRREELAASVQPVRRKREE